MKYGFDGSGCHNTSNQKGNVHTNNMLLSTFCLLSMKENNEVKWQEPTHSTAQHSTAQHSTAHTQHTSLNSLSAQKPQEPSNGEKDFTPVQSSRSISNLNSENGGRNHSG